MNILSIIFLVLFFIAAGAHLTFCFMQNEKIRKITKCTIMLMTLLLVIAMKEQNPFFYIAICFGLAGDAILLFKDNRKLFIAGSIAFFLVHLCYIVLMSTKMPSYLNWCFYGILICAGYLIVSTVVPYSKKYLKKLAIPNAIYMYTLLCEIVMAIFLIIGNPSFAAVIVLIGVLLFTASDILLTYTIFSKPLKRENFYIMLSYSLGQIGIILGLALIT